MNNFWSGFLIALIPTLVVSVITAVLTVKLTTKQYCSQRWWESKASAYSDIMGRLSTIRYCFDKWFSEIEEGAQYTKEFKDRISKEYMEAEAELGKTAHAGAFIVSKEAAELLEKLVKELNTNDPGGNWIDDLERGHKQVSVCLEKLREIAKRDLLKGRIF